MPMMPRHHLMRRYALVSQSKPEFGLRVNAAEAMLRKIIRIVSKRYLYEYNALT